MLKINHNMLTYIRKFTILSLLGLTLAACSSSPDDSDETLQWTAEKLYQEAKDSMQIGDYETAIDYLEKIEARFPFGRYAQQAQLESAYVYYKFNEPESAISAADRFIKLHPRHSSVDYAYYIKGLASFPVGNNFLENVMKKDSSMLDPGTARRSFGYFSTLVKKFPDSNYAKDSKKRMAFLRNNLAMHEINVAKFYLKRGAYVAAVNRAKYILENYQQTPAVPMALEILKQAYNELNISELAADTDRIIKLNQKGNKSLENKSGNSQDLEQK